MRYYLLREWKANLRARPFIAIVVVLLAATGLTGITMLQAQLSQALAWWEERFEYPHVEVYFDASVQEDSIIALSNRLTALTQIQQTEYISATEAQREAEEYLGVIAFSVLPENPLPASVRAVLAPEFRTPDHVRRLADSLANIPGIVEVVSANQQIAISSRGKKIITEYSAVFLVTSIVWTFFWLFIGVYLVMRVPSPEWKVWRYLGARPGWFRWPPMAEGFTLGVLISAVAWFFTWLAPRFAWVSGNLHDQSQPELLILFVAPAAIGSLAGWLAYRVHLHRGAAF